MSRRIKLLVNYLLGPLLCIGIGYSIYHQLQAQPNLEQRWAEAWLHVRKHGWPWIVAALGLMALNWSLEAWKWQQLVNHLMPMRWRQALLSVLAGVSFTMLTPNRMGEFLGRVLYMPDGSRMRAAALTTLSSLSQLMITMAAGLLGLAYLQQQPAVQQQWPAMLTSVLQYATIAALLVVALIYFNAGVVIRLLHKWPPLQRYQYVLQAIGEIGRPELLRILGIALLRYTVFLGQYWLVFRWFGVQTAWPLVISGAAVMFLMLAAVPTVSLAELGIRGQASLFVFGLFTTQNVALLLATGAIWVINIILPALAGSLILLGVKLFGKT